MGDDLQQAVVRWGGVAQILGSAHVVGGGAGQAVQAVIEQLLEHAFGQALRGPQITRQAHGNPLVGGETRDDFADRPDGVHVLVGVQMAGPDTVVQAALPLRLEFFVYGAAILMAEPETGAGQVEVEQAGAVAEGPARQNAPAQRAASGEVEVQADASFQQRMPGH